MIVRQNVVILYKLETIRTSHDFIEPKAILYKTVQYCMVQYGTVPDQIKSWFLVPLYSDA